MKQSVIVITGCTASGKSELAETLAWQLRTSAGGPATIMAVDSMQVYRGMDIGTAKPDLLVRSKIPHVLIDVADPWEQFSAARFVELAGPILEDHRRRRQPLILVAGTVLYLRALLEGLFEGPAADMEFRADLQARSDREGPARLHEELRRVDPVAGEKIHPHDLRRIIRGLEVFHLTGRPISELQTQWSQKPADPTMLWLGIERDRADLNGRINRRVKAMLAAGLVEEVHRLTTAGRPLSAQAASAVGYRQVLAHLAGRGTLEEAIEEIKIDTRHLAKLQRTWLKRFAGIHWIKTGPDQSGADILPLAVQWLQD